MTKSGTVTTNFSLMSERAILRRLVSSLFPSVRRLSTLAGPVDGAEAEVVVTVIEAVTVGVKAKEARPGALLLLLLILLVVSLPYSSLIDAVSLAT